MYPGTKPVQQDKRDYSFHRTFGAATLTLPDEYNCDFGATMPNQNNEGAPYGCTGYTQAELCQDQDGILYLPYWTYRKTCQMEGHDTDRGCEIRNSLESTRKFGALAMTEATDAQAATHKRTAYFNVDRAPGLDWFDSLRSALWSLRTEKRSISIGTPWYPEFEQPEAGIIPATFSGDPQRLFWHNYKICGWKTINGQPYLLAKTWQGRSYGDNGWAYFSRETFNALLNVSGTAAFTLAHTSGDIQTIKISLLQQLIDLYKRLIAALQAQKPVTPPVLPVEPPKPAEPTTPTPEALQWSTPVLARHSVRVICDEMGLTLAEKNIITACIQQESGFHINAINHNSDARHSTDYGICQFNDYWYKNVISPHDALTNPELAVRTMIKCYKAGRLKDWVSYSSGAYKRWLPK